MMRIDAPVALSYLVLICILVGAAVIVAAAGAVAGAAVFGILWLVGLAGGGIAGWSAGGGMLSVAAIAALIYAPSVLDAARAWRRP